MKRSRVVRQLVTVECIGIVGPGAPEDAVTRLDFEAYVRDGVMQMACPTDVYVTAGETETTTMEELTP